MEHIPCKSVSAVKFVITELGTDVHGHLWQLSTIANILVVCCLVPVNPPDRFLVSSWPALIAALSVSLEWDTKCTCVCPHWLSPPRIQFCNQPSCWTHKLSLMSHFLNVLKLLWSFLTYQWFLLGFKLFIVTRCPQKDFQYYWIQTQDKNHGTHLKSAFVYWALDLFSSQEWSLERERQAGSYLSDGLMRMSYVFQTFLKLRHYAHVDKLLIHQLIHALDQYLVGKRAIYLHYPRNCRLF